KRKLLVTTSKLESRNGRKLPSAAMKSRAGYRSFPSLTMPTDTSAPVYHLAFHNLKTSSLCSPKAQPTSKQKHWSSHWHSTRDIATIVPALTCLLHPQEGDPSRYAVGASWICENDRIVLSDG